MSRRAREVDPLRSWARRHDGAVEVRLAVSEALELAPGDVEVKLRARRHTLTVPGKAAEGGEVTFSVPDRGLRRLAWQLALRPAGQPAGTGGFTAVDARLLAVPRRPVALLTGPVPKTTLPPPVRRPADPSPPAPGRGDAAGRNTRQGLRQSVSRRLPQGLRRGVRRARAAASRPQRRAAAAGDGSGKGDRAKARPRGKRGAGGGGRRLTRDGNLRAPLRLLDRSRWERAVVVGTPQTVDAIAAWVPRLAPAPVVVVLTSAADAATVERLRSSGEVDVVTAEDRAALLTTLKVLGSLDVIVSTVPDIAPEESDADADGSGVGADESLSAWPTARDVMALVFPYLRVGGTFLEDRTVPGTDPDATLPTWLHDVAEARARSSRRHSQGREAEVRDSLGALLMTPQLAAVTHRTEHYYKLREDEVLDVLPKREPELAVEIAATRPAGTLMVASAEIPHGSRRGEVFPDHLDYPEMTLRHYRGAVDSGGSMLLFSGNTVLPESFRWPHTSYMENSRCLSSEEVARIKRRWLPKESLDGAWYHLDCAYSGHFGHYATETIARLWAWDEAKRQVPDLKAFVHVRPDLDLDPGQGTLERTFLRAYGIADEDIVTVQRPVRLQEVFGATPMWQNTTPYYAHPDLRQVWERISAGLLKDVDPAEVGRHERIFVSRGAEYSHRRGCRNAAEVEALFRERGFHIFCPEDLTLTEQAALFAGARVVAGYGGSAMANLFNSSRLEALIVLSHHGYVARGEHLSMSLLGGDFHYFWAESDVEPPSRGRSLESFRSSWEFDLAAYGEELRSVLAAY